MELEFIEWLETVLPNQCNASPGIGDDAAVWNCSATTQQVVTTDSLVDNVHFQSSNTPLDKIGHKCLGASLSDLAAMCAKPKYAVVSLVSPDDWALHQLQDFYKGILDLATRFKCQVIGGDFNTHAGPFIVNVTAIGESTPATIRYRFGSRCGDSIYVTGSIGGSLRGQHLCFTPRIEQGLLLGMQPAVHSVTDLTDGLVVDLNSLLSPESLGATLHSDDIPISDSALDCPDPLHAALFDGEDFELIFTASEEFDINHFNQLSPVGVTQIGRVTDRPGIHLHNEVGDPVELDAVGYSH